MAERKGDVILEAKDLTINFGGLRAVDNLSFSIKDNEIFSMIGPNGAGKTTVFNIVSGFYKPNAGSIIFREKNLVRLKPHEISELGIGRTYQNLELFSRLSVLENLLIAKHLQIKTNFWTEMVFGRRVKREELRIKEEAMRILEYLEIDQYAYKPISEFPFPIQKRIELARALALQPKVLVLDEPAGGLNIVESEELAELIQKIRNDLKITVFLVEHDMSVVMSISDRIIVLDYGKKIAEGVPAEIQINPQVIEAYLGKGQENVGA